MILFTLVPFLDEFSKKKLTDVMARVWIQPDPTLPKNIGASRILANRETEMRLLLTPCMINSPIDTPYGVPLPIYCSHR